jgi:hypothetical protein
MMPCAKRHTRADLRINRPRASDPGWGPTLRFEQTPSVPAFTTAQTRRPQLPGLPIIGSKNFFGNWRTDASLCRAHEESPLAIAGCAIRDAGLRPSSRDMRTSSASEPNGICQGPSTFVQRSIAWHNNDGVREGERLRKLLG